MGTDFRVFRNDRQLIFPAGKGGFTHYMINISIKKPFKRQKQQICSILGWKFIIHILCMTTIYKK